MRNKNKLISLGVTVLLIVFMIVTSKVVVAYYPQMNEKVDKLIIENQARQSAMNQYFVETNYSLYYELRNQLAGGTLTPADVYVNENDTFNEYYSLDTFNESIKDFYETLVRDSKAIDYFAYDHTSKKWLTNINDTNIDEIKDITQEELNTFYDYYFILQYDGQGQLRLTESSVDLYLEGLLMDEENMRYRFLENNTVIKPIRNMSYFYGVRDIEYVNKENSFYNYTYYRMVANQYILVVGGAVILIFLLIPYKLIQAAKWLMRVVFIPLEMLLVGFYISIYPVYFTTQYNLKDYVENRVSNILLFYISPPITNEHLILVFNMANWILYFIALFIGVVLIKYIYKIGLKRYIKEHVILYKCYEAIRSAILKLIKYLSRMNLQERSIKVILRFIIINGFVMVGFCLLWFFGIIGVLLYSIVLYVVANRVLKDIKLNYEKLLERTSHLASGSLEMESIEEDLGLFEPLKKHIEVIQQDFKKSVEEEVCAQKFKTDLITNVSHDLKTPLTSIISYVDLLKQDELSKEKQREYIDILDRKSARLQNLIEDLFEMSKVSSGNIELYKEKVDVVALIKQTFFELEDKIQVSGIIFRTQFPEHKVYLTLDSMRTFRVFDNLINNIAKYAMPNSRAYVLVEDNEKDVVITLKNTAREELTFDTDYITERFVRGDESRGTEGSGLGLAIAKSFIELQEGQFEVETDGDLFKVKIYFRK